MDSQELSVPCTPGDIRAHEQNREQWREKKRLGVDKEVNLGHGNRFPDQNWQQEGK